MKDKHHPSAHKQIEMKKLLISSVLLAFALNIFSQTVSHKDSLTSKEYLEKSNRQKKTARILLGIGGTAIVAGGLISVGNNDDLDGQLATAFSGIPLMVVGGILSLISTSVFDASRKNKKRAEEAASSIRIDKATSTDLVEVEISPEPDEKIVLITSGKKHPVRSISILDKKGILVNQYEDINNTKFQLPFLQLTPGQYTLIIQFDEGPIARQIVIK